MKLALKITLVSVLFSGLSGLLMIMWYSRQMLSACSQALDGSGGIFQVLSEETTEERDPFRQSLIEQSRRVMAGECPIPIVVVRTEPKDELPVTAPDSVVIEQQELPQALDKTATPTFANLVLNSLGLATRQMVIVNEVGGLETLPLPQDYDEQTLSINGHELKITDGNKIVLPDNQTLSIEGRFITIEGGNVIQLPIASSSETGLLSSADYELFKATSAPVTFNAAFFDTSGDEVSLSDTGVTDGNYGGPTEIPIVTVDKKGRITAVTSQSIPTATSSQAGLLSADNWQVFSSKENPLTFVAAGGLERVGDTVSNTLITGLESGQTIHGGTGSGGGLVIQSTSHSTKGLISLNPDGGNVGINTYLPLATLDANGTLRFGGYAREELPTAGVAGQLARVTDDQRGIWMDQGEQWFRLGGEAVNAKEYGARGNGSTDDTAALSEALAAAVATSKKLYIPAGNYKISGTTGSRFAIAESGVEVFGDGIGKTIIQYEDDVVLTGSTFVFRLNGLYQSIHDLSIYNGSNMSGSYDWIAISITTGAYFPHIYNVEIAGIYGASTAGGSGINLYQPWNSAEISTTLGTDVSPGVAEVSPPSMDGIYAGRRLVIGGNTEEVIVTSRTATSFTATFVNSHSASDAVTSRSNGNQYALIENNLIRDSYQASAMIINSSSNILRNNRIISVGSTSNQHGFYIQGGKNLVEGNYVEGARGYSFAGHKAVPHIDSGGDRYINNTSINPGGHMVVNNLNSDGTNIEIPDGTGLNRQVVISGNLFKRTKDSGDSLVGVMVLNVPAVISNNILEDTLGNRDGSNWIEASSPNSIVESNILRVTHASAGSNGIITRENSTIANNQFVNWNDGAAIRAQVGSRVIGNTIQMTNGTGISIGGDNVEVSGNHVIATGGYIFNIGASNIGVTIHDNTFSQTSTYIALLQSETYGFSFYNNSWSGGMLRHDTTSPNALFYNNEGLMSYGGSTAGMLTRSMGQLISFPKAEGEDLFHGSPVTLNAEGSLRTTTTTDTFFVGIAIGRAYTSASGGKYIAGQPGTEFPGAKVDGPWTAGNIGVISTTSVGELHDTGSQIPPSSGSYVLFLDSGEAAGTAKVKVMRTL